MVEKCKIIWTIASIVYLSTTLSLFIFSNSNEMNGCFKSNCTFIADRGFGHEGCSIELTWTSMNTTKHYGCEYPFRRCPSFGVDQPCWMTDDIWCPLMTGCINPGYFFSEIIFGFLFGLGVFYIIVSTIFYFKERQNYSRTVEVV